MHYFAYGSNLHSQRLLERTPSAQPVTVARLSGYQLRFHKRSNLDGSGKCDAWRTDRAKDFVLGFVWDLPPEEKTILDRIEDVGFGYRVEGVEVEASQGPLNAFTYCAEASHIEPGLRPFHWYKNYVVQGAREHGLDPAYIEQIEQVVADRDPDRERAKRNRF